MRAVVGAGSGSLFLVGDLTHGTHPQLQCSHADAVGGQGWCVARDPKWKCLCEIDGLAGDTCDEVGPC